MKMNREQLLEALKILNNRLRKHGIYGEIGIYGGAVMCLVFDARENTQDIDAIFSPKMDIMKLAKEVGRDLGIGEDWLNDGVKGFISDNNNLVPYMEMSNLRIYTATPDYMFAMKAMSSRVENKNEMRDIAYLIRRLNIRTIEQAAEVIYRYYPNNRILPKTQYVIMEIIERAWNN